MANKGGYSEFDNKILSAFERLIKEGRVDIRPKTYPGRGWIDVIITIDGKLIFEKGCAI